MGRTLAEIRAALELEKQTNASPKEQSFEEQMREEYEEYLNENWPTPEARAAGKKNKEIMTLKQFIKQAKQDEQWIQSNLM